MKAKPQQILKLYSRLLGFDNNQAGIEKCLYNLYLIKKMTPTEISRDIFNKTALRVDPNNLYYWISRSGINLKSLKNRPRIIQKAIEKQGYNSTSEFFLSNAKLTYEEMAEALGVSATTVRKEYIKFLKKEDRHDSSSS